MINLDRYIKIVKLPSDFNENHILAYIPKPKDDDYSRGYITRYFVQKVNDKNGLIYEINPSNNSKYTNNAFWSNVSLDWMISGGTLDEIKTANSKSVRIASKKLPAIQLYLPNLSQFSKQ